MGLINIHRRRYDDKNIFNMMIQSIYLLLTKGDCYYIINKIIIYDENLIK
jgi:hypothetical protein